MGTLLDNDIAPLWVWIVVIAVGSVLLIGTIMAVLVCCVRRYRSKPRKDLESGGLTRRVTLKNGKLVEQTNHVSLTGSNFGLMSDRGPELLASPATARGSSPFDWWAGIKERSASRQSQRSQDTASVLDNSASAAGGLYLAIDASPPRLSLTSLNERNTIRSTTSLSDVSTISKPLIAMTAETRRARAVNFSRPQPRRIPTNASRSQRLSIINETTPRNSFLSISSLRARIVSWASSPNEHDQFGASETEKPRTSEKEKEKDLDQNYFRISEKAPTLTLSFGSSSAPTEPIRVTSPQELPTTSEPRSRSSSPVDFTLQQLTEFLDAPTPELPSRHPSRRSMYTNTSEPQIITTHSRSSSTNNFSRKPMLTTSPHSRTSSATNFSRRHPIADHSRSSSMNRCSSTTNFSRLANVNDNSRTNSNISWFEVPVAQATLSEPFDMPIACRGSRASVWSSETKEATLQQQTFQTPAKSASNAEQVELAKSRPKTVALADQPVVPHESSIQNKVEPEEARTPEPNNAKEKQKDIEKRRSRGRSTDRERRRSRGPIRARSVSKGRNVLRKRSLQRPEIQMIGAVDPSSLENLDVVDL